MRPRFAESRTTRRVLFAVTALAASLALQGCVYHMPIQQGNFLEQRAVSQLKWGMTRSQVALSARHTDGAGLVRQRSLGLLSTISSSGTCRRTSCIVTSIVYFADEKVVEVR